MDVGQTTAIVSSSASAIGAIKMAVEFIKSLRENSASKELSSTLVEVLDKLLSVQLSVFELNEEILKQSDELRKLRQTLTEKGNYTLIDLGNRKVVYEFNGTEMGVDGSIKTNLHTPHYACQLCLDKEGVRSVLQTKANVSSFATWDVLLCTNCGTELDIEGSNRSIL